MKIRDIFVWLLIFIVGSLIVSFLINPNSFQSFKSNIKSITGFSIDSFSSINFEDFNKNPEKYVGKNVTATGKYENYILRDYGCGKGTTLVDNDKGYELPFCPLNNPNIRFEVGKIYTIKGTIKKFEMEDFWSGSINHTTGLYENRKVTYYVLIEN